MNAQAEALNTAIVINDEQRAEIAQLWRTKGDLEQKIREAQARLDRMEAPVKRQRDALIRISELKGECDEGEDGACGKCAHCLAYFGLWGTL